MIPLFRTFLLPAVAILTSAVMAAPSDTLCSKPVDDRLGELFEEYHDVSTGTFREVRAEILLKKIKEVASFQEAGFSSLTTAITCLRYRLVGTKDDPGLSRYGFVLYVIGSGSAVEKYDVIAAQITYLAPSNVAYYRNVSLLENVPPHVFLKMIGSNRDHCMIRSDR